MAFIKTQLTETVAREDRRHLRACPDLIAALDDADASARRWAARDLLECKGAAAALVGRLKRESDLAVREVILTTLTRLGDATAVAGLIDCLRSEDAALRNEAIEAMQQMPDAVAPIMQVLLIDADPDVRIFAVNILESLCHPDVESWLIAVIDTEPHVNVCAAALDLLSEVGSGAMVAALVRLKGRFADEPYIQFAADLALGRNKED
ncbi:HEAT repeat domain-containing protein [Janthinobacterium sp. LB2P10]|uniref:HEAT repeat domain-containing protein n=1 Tax=Janthinobacterium sp. LB2P10 TaxID=3424194 RepID=UPI003F22820D